MDHGVDEREMGERLREVPEVATGARVDLLRVQLEGAGVGEHPLAQLPGAAVLSPQEVLDHPQVAATGVFESVDFPGLERPAPVPRVPVWLSETPFDPEAGYRKAHRFYQWRLTRPERVEGRREIS